MTIISFKRNYCHIFLMLSPMSYFPCLNKFVIYQGVLEVPNAPIEGCVRENLQQGIVDCPLKVDNDELV